MLKIRQAQLDAFADAAALQFETSMVGHCLKFAPPLCSHSARNRRGLRCGAPSNRLKPMVSLTKDTALCMEAVAALGRLRESSAMPMLEKLLANPKEDVNVRGNAYISIGHLGDPASEALLKRTAESPDVFLSACAR
jgi:HEAT repeat protein